MQQNIEINKIHVKWYAENFDTARQGISQAAELFFSGLEKNPVTGMFNSPAQAHNFMLQAWKHIWRHTIASLKGCFLKKELSLLVDIHNSHKVAPITFGNSTLAMCISNAILLDNAGEKWDVNADHIIEKAKGLSNIQAFCLELWAVGFWYGKNQAADFYDYIDQLV